MTAPHRLRRGPRVGLLGGSFNPAHGGHMRISELALKLLDLDQVWWLVSPQNPLKDEAGMAPFSERLAQAREIVTNRRITVSDLEHSLSCRYTADTLAELNRRFPRHRFVWIMGADNLIQLPRWRRWRNILETMPVAVFDRPSYSHRALAGKVATRFAQQRIGLGGQSSRRLADTRPPAWTFLWAANDPASASALRSDAG